MVLCYSESNNKHKRFELLTYLLAYGVSLLLVLAES